MMKRQRQLQSNLSISGDISAETQPIGCLQAHSCLSPLQKYLSGHPDIGQHKQRHKLCRVFGQPAIANLAVTELAFDHPKWMFDFGANTCLELLCLFSQRTPGRMLLLLALARAHGNVPVHARGLIALGCTLIARVSKDNSLLPIQQRVPLSHIVYVGGCTDDVCVPSRSQCLHRCGTSLRSAVGWTFWFDAPAGPVDRLCSWWNSVSIQCGIDHRADLKHETLSGEFVVDELQDVRAQAVIFKQMFETHSTHPVWDSLGTAQAHEVTMVNFQSMTTS